MVTVKAPTYGIKTDNPTRTDNKAVYLSPNTENNIAAAKPTIKNIFPVK